MSRRGRPPHPDVLTPREWEVLALLREGLSDQAIADRLGISLDGAKYHVREILSKLGVSSRQEAAAWEPEEQAPARRWVALPLVARIAGALVVVAAVGGLGLLAWGVVRTGGETDAQTAGDRTPGEMSALMLAGRQLRGEIKTASVERTTVGAAREALAGEWLTTTPAGSGERQPPSAKGSPNLSAGDAELWLVRFTGEFDVLLPPSLPDDFPPGGLLVTVEMPVDPGNRVERHCMRVAAYVRDDFRVEPIAGPELSAGECLAGGEASLEAAVATAGQASYRTIGPRGLFDASAQLTDGASVWEVTISDLLSEPESPSSPECGQLVVRLDAGTLQLLDMDPSSSANCAVLPAYSMTPEEVRSIAKAKADEEIYLGTIEKASVERLRMGDLTTFLHAAKFGGAVQYFVDIHGEGLPSASPEAPAWRVAMLGAMLLDNDPTDLFYDAGGCRRLTVYFDDTARKPIFMSYELLDPGNCDLPIPEYPNNQ